MLKETSIMVSLKLTIINDYYSQLIVYKKIIYWVFLNNQIKLVVRELLKHRFTQIKKIYGSRGETRTFL
jgi:hypothetical protein